MELIPYTWRGKTYKSFRGLFKAINARHPGCFISFDKDTMYIRNRKTGFGCKYPVKRNHPIANEIASEPLGD